MSHLCCSILVCSVAPDIAFISPLSRSYGANESEHERKSGVYHMHMRSHLQHKQLRTELPKDVRAALVTLEQMTATNRVVGSRVCMHVEHVALALVLANCVVCTLVFSTSGGGAAVCVCCIYIFICVCVGAGQLCRVHSGLQHKRGGGAVFPFINFTCICIYMYIYICVLCVMWPQT
jgi:hypothetical protein